MRASPGLLLRAPHLRPPARDASGAPNSTGRSTSRLGTTHRVRATVLLRILGIAPSARAHIGWLARRAKGKHARDSTKYGLSRASTRSFYLHHTQRLSLAAVLGDAKGIRRKLNGEKAKRIAGGDARATSI